ncbi:NfeD family protein [Thermococcus gammatolerans]|uniref:Nodulation efficiency protein D related protein (NefD) n=1 Tax=Thermococcus gammatolerans (strain DSM 15229 / JCM 11827 / EJ3) TaxID=593117 RepID=C5A4X2_THEGJ|nr:NfeD family protein [Thermococcus gammatolerans]ACS33284.1 Nodulation efficiency protein D related protein (nefD) [Thermococcus gammatolerans EJ3]
MAGGKGVSLLKLIALIADEIIVGVFLLVVLPALGMGVPVLVTGLVLGVLLVKDVLIAPYVLGGGLEKRPKAGPESLVGRTAVVVDDLSPEGLVKLDGELWRARCFHGTARRGEKVRVVEVDGTKLLVELPASEEPR